MAESDNKSALTASPERKYPEIAVERETAVILAAQGMTYAAIGAEINVSPSTVSVWFNRDQATADALANERAERHAEIRGRLSGLLAGAADVVTTFLEVPAGQAPTKDQAILAFKLLEHARALPRIVGDEDRGTEEERVIDLLAEQLRRRGVGGGDVLDAELVESGAALPAPGAANTAGEGETDAPA